MALVKWAVEEELDEPLCPVAPPFISNDNPVRASINPAIYPSKQEQLMSQLALAATARLLSNLEPWLWSNGRG
jgi:hypothetical protein